MKTHQQLLAIIYRPDGSEIPIQPKNGTDFNLEELNGIVEGYIEVVPLKGDRIMVVNEEGKLKGLPFNQKATEIFWDAHRVFDQIAGNALVCDTTQIK